MFCATGTSHTVSVSNDGIVYSFGSNDEGQLGLGYYTEDFIFTPSPISNLPKIKQVTCGGYYTICVDYEGYLWSFGRNEYGQLGIGNRTSHNTPQKIEGISLAQSVSCGSYHTLIITNDSNLWSFGNNESGQACLETRNSFDFPQQTKFSNVKKISTGAFHSFFQNNIGEIYGCGANSYGQLGIENTYGTSQIKVCLIPLPHNIIQISCGYFHSLFLDSDGNVYSVGYNMEGCLGLGHTKKTTTITKIQHGCIQDTGIWSWVLKNSKTKIDLPPIEYISAFGHSSCLIDSDKNLWGFGNNKDSQLGFQDKVPKQTLPVKVISVNNVEQISSGGKRLILKDSDSNIHVFGCHLTKRALKPEYFSIWGDTIIPNRKAKSARK